MRPDSRPTARWNRVIDLLDAEPRRQIVLSLLGESPDRWLSLPEAARVPGDSAAVRELETSLHHVHLPKLSEPGYVRWRADPFGVRRGPRFDEVGTVVEVVSANADRLPEALVAGCALLERNRSDSCP